MTSFVSRGLLAALAAAAVFVVGWQVHAETNRVKFPENLDQLVHYTTVRRGNVTEHILATREAIDAIKSRKPIPAGTHFVLVDQRDGELYRTSSWRRALDGARTTTTAAARATGSSSGSGPTGRST
jgi:hypothetical protein